MAGLLDYLEGIGETGATIGSGLLSGAVGAPYGLYKGLTRGKLSTAGENISMFMDEAQIKRLKKLLGEE